MDKLTNLLETASKLNINIDTDTLGYYWYKVELMTNIFGVFYVIAVCCAVALPIYFISKNDD